MHCLVIASHQHFLVSSSQPRNVQQAWPQKVARYISLNARYTVCTLNSSQQTSNTYPLINEETPACNSLYNASNNKGHASLHLLPANVKLLFPRCTSTTTPWRHRGAAGVGRACCCSCSQLPCHTRHNPADNPITAGTLDGHEVTVLPLQNMHNRHVSGAVQHPNVLLPPAQSNTRRHPHTHQSKHNLRQLPAAA